MIKHAIIMAVLACFISSHVWGQSNMAFPRGIRLSNPGNIVKDDSNQWQGMTRLQDDPRFVRFDTPHSGIRALVKLLVNYKKLHNCDNIYDIINRYAPPNENSTYAYIRSVSSKSGFFPNETLDMQDMFTLMKLAQAIVMHENGVAPPTLPKAWYEDIVYVRAVEDALGEE
jgi:hypothetical protein